MSNKNYLAGRRFEYEMVRILEERGFSCIRASGSHGIYDIVAFSPNRPPEMVQCKRVDKSATGFRLIKRFEKDTVPSKYYKQVLAIKVKGTKTPITYTV